MALPSSTTAPISPSRFPPTPHHVPSPVPVPVPLPLPLPLARPFLTAHSRVQRAQPHNIAAAIVLEVQILPLEARPLIAHQTALRLPHTHTHTHTRTHSRTQTRARIYAPSLRPILSLLTHAARTRVHAYHPPRSHALPFLTTHASAALLLPVYTNNHTSRTRVYAARTNSPARAPPSASSNAM